jgi:hypothetical protein
MQSIRERMQCARRRPWAGGRGPSRLGNPPWRRRRWSASRIVPAMAEVGDEPSAPDQAVQRGLQLEVHAGQASEHR